LNDYVDRELPGTQRSEVSAHLEACEECAREVRELERAVSLLRRLPEPELPPGFADAVIERVRAGESSPTWLRSLRGLFQPTLTVTATAAVAGLAVFTVVGGGTFDLPGGGTTGDAEAPQRDVARVAADAPSAAIASRAPNPAVARAPAIGPSQAQAPIRLAAATPGGGAAADVVRQMRRQRRALELVQRGHRDTVARTLRGAGHPHSATLAAHFEDSPDSIQLIEGREVLLRAR
jgi:anti-sigma factor RsiW